MEGICCYVLHYRLPAAMPPPVRATTCVAANTTTISMGAAIKDISSASACHITNEATICITAALVVVPQQPKWGILHVVSNDGVCLQDTITINAICAATCLSTTNTITICDCTMVV